jgi:hypothetical protein
VKAERKKERSDAMLYRLITMKRVFATAILLSAVCMPAYAVSLTNKDQDGHTMVVTEGGVRSEVAIASGETLSVCDGGCFVTFPNGDRAALAGTETVEIINGTGTIQ